MASSSGGYSREVNSQKKMLYQLLGMSSSIKMSQHYDPYEMLLGLYYQE